MDKIFIRGLALEGIIGVYPHEKGNKQPLSLDLELYVDTRLSAASDLIADTIDYDVVAQRIIELVSNSQFELIESLAQHIANVLLQEFKIEKLRCTLYKPQALSVADTVGITIERSKANPIKQ